MTMITRLACCRELIILAFVVVGLVLCLLPVRAVSSSLSSTSSSSTTTTTTTFSYQEASGGIANSSNDSGAGDGSSDTSDTSDTSDASDASSSDGDSDSDLNSSTSVFVTVGDEGQMDEIEVKIQQKPWPSSCQNHDDLRQEVPMPGMHFICARQLADRSMEVSVIKDGYEPNWIFSINLNHGRIEVLFEFMASHMYNKDIGNNNVDNNSNDNRNRNSDVGSSSSSSSSSSRIGRKRPMDVSQWIAYDASGSKVIWSLSYLAYSGNAIVFENGYYMSPGVKVGHVSRLSKTKVMTTLSLRPLIFKIESLLKVEECDGLIKEAKFGKSENITRYRFASGEHNVMRNSNATANIEEIMEKYTKLPLNHQRHIQVSHYKVGYESTGPLSFKNFTYTNRKEHDNRRIVRDQSHKENKHVATMIFKLSGPSAEDSTSNAGWDFVLRSINSSISGSSSGSGSSSSSLSKNKLVSDEWNCSNDENNPNPDNLNSTTMVAASLNKTSALLIYHLSASDIYDVGSAVGICSQVATDIWIASKTIWSRDQGDL